MIFKWCTYDQVIAYLLVLLLSVASSFLHGFSHNRYACHPPPPPPPPRPLSNPLHCRTACVCVLITGEKSSAKPPQGGEKRWLKLELKLVADVGLVGVPNAGENRTISSDGMGWNWMGWDGMGWDGMGRARAELV